MALLNSEIVRIKYELGFSTLSVGAEPYVGISAIFSQVVQTYAAAGAVTTSSTAVTATSSETPVTLTLTSATGFSQFDTVVVDVDERQESATVQSISGASLVVMLSKAHTGTYPVTVEGSESIVRGILRKLISLDAPDGAIAKAVGTAGIKRIEGDVEFFGTDGGSMSRIAQVQEYREYLRSELSRALFGSGGGRGGATRVAVY